MLSQDYPSFSFNLAFSNGLLHEWEDAKEVFSDIYRVLKPGGKVRVSDLRRDLAPDIYQFILGSCNGPAIQKGFETSVYAAYTKDELEKLLNDIGFARLEVIAHPYGLVVVGEK